MGTLSFNQITIHNRWPCKYLMRESHGENDSVLRNTHIDKDTHMHAQRNTSIDCKAPKSRHPSLSCKTEKKCNRVCLSNIHAAS